MGAWIFRGLLAVGLLFFLWEGEAYSPHAARLPQMVAGVTLLFVFLDAVASWRKERGAQKAAPAEAPLPESRGFLETPRFYATAGGIRLGTPAVTTRGMGTGEMQALAGHIAAVLARPEDREVLTATREEIRSFVTGFLPPKSPLND